MTYPRDLHNQTTLLLDAEGRLTLPESIRQELDLHEGDRLVLTLTNDGVVQLVSLKQQIRKMRGTLANPTSEQSVVDELIRERHQQVIDE